MGRFIKGDGRCRGPIGYDLEATNVYVKPGAEPFMVVSIGADGFLHISGHVNQLRELDNDDCKLLETAIYNFMHVFVRQMG